MESQFQMVMAGKFPESLIQKAHTDMAGLKTVKFIIIQLFLMITWEIIMSNEAIQLT